MVVMCQMCVLSCNRLSRLGKFEFKDSSDPHSHTNYHYLSDLEN